MQVLASAYAEQVLPKEVVVNSISLANNWMIDNLGLQHEYDRLNLQFDGIKVDRVITSEDIIDLGDNIKVHFIEVPGHSRCSIAAYVPQIKALFPSDAAPLPVSGVNRLTFPSPQYDFSLYKESIRKLTSCKTEICAFEHYGVITGNQARMVIREGLQETAKFEELIVKLYQQIGDFNETAKVVAAATSERSKFTFISPDTWANVARAEARSVLRYARLLD